MISSRCPRADPQTAGQKQRMRNPRTKRRRPLVVPVFLPHEGCPHRCVFCNQHVITHCAAPLRGPEALRELVERFLSYGGDTRGPVQIAFYGGNFLGLPQERLALMLRTASSFVSSGRAHGLRFSTRPETVNPGALDLVGRYPVTTVEVGAQSMDDRVLAACRRGHSARDTEAAIGLLKRRGYETGVQLMVGLPGEDREHCLATARRIAGLAPDFVRIYPTVVLHGSPLARWYAAGRYQPLSLEESVDRAKTMYAVLHAKRIRVVRMGLHISASLRADDSVVAGPLHPAFGHLVRAAWYLERASALLASHCAGGSAVTLRVHPTAVACMRGQHNANMSQLKQRFELKALTVAADSTLGEDEIKLHCENGRHASGEQPCRCG
jgi:histone acetyltransferase (RNA polymerase elongator complex component)